VRQECLAAFLADPEIMLAAMNSISTDALRDAAPELKADRQFMLASVKQDGTALAYADLELMSDKEIVLTAVGHDRGQRTALQWAAPELQADREVVLAAVKASYCALAYASKELKADREVVLAAAMQSPHAALYASRCASPELKAADVLVQFATAQSVCDFDSCMKIMRKKYIYDIDGKWTETAIDVMGRCANINDKPTVLKQVEAFVKRASHPTKGLLGKLDRKAYVDEFV
jgi:hypothetical protein